jgi:hypothetical protein
MNKDTLWMPDSLSVVKHKTILKELSSSRPRATAVVGFAYLDSLLNELLRLRLTDEEEFEEETIRMSSAMRIKLCYLTGIIDKEEKVILDSIRKIRNHFAHNLEISSFAFIQQKPTKINIPDECDRLVNYVERSKNKYSAEIKIKGIPPKDEKEKYIAVVCFFVSIFIKRIDKCRPLEPIY